MRNIDYAIKRIAHEKQIDEKIVKAVINHYWKQVVTDINSFEHEAIFIRHVGTFYIQYDKLRNAISRAIIKYRNNDKSENLELLKKLLSIRERTSKRYYSKWKSRT